MNYKPTDTNKISLTGAAANYKQLAMFLQLIDLSYVWVKESLNNYWILKL